MYQGRSLSFLRLETGFRDGIGKNHWNHKGLFAFYSSQRFIGNSSFLYSRNFSNTKNIESKSKGNTSDDHSLPKVTVLGVGGCGGNAVNNLIAKKLTGVNFIAANTDKQALSISKAETKIQLGLRTARGRGAGSKIEIGRDSAIESLEEVLNAVDDSAMVFVAAGMGGGTGTGAAPVIAKELRSKGILTVGVVTTPFDYEGTKTMDIARIGLRELAAGVDTLVTIPNQKLLAKMPGIGQVEAREKVDMVLCDGVKSVTDLIFIPGEINLDFADLCTIMKNGGKALFGTGEAEGQDRAIQAAKKALDNPLFEDLPKSGAHSILINIYGDSQLKLEEMAQIAETIRAEAARNANIIFGATVDESMKGKVRVSFVMTGLGGSFFSDFFRLFKTMW